MPTGQYHINIMLWCLYNFQKVDLSLALLLTRKIKEGTSVFTIYLDTQLLAK